MRRLAPSGRRAVNTSGPDMPVRVVVFGESPADLVSQITALPASLDLHFVASHTDSAAARAALQASVPDIAVVQGMLRDGSGFDLIAALPATSRPPAVVFVSAREVDAVQAFELRATDFVMAPAEPVRFRAALVRARNQVRQLAVLRTADELQRLLGPVAADEGSETATATGWPARDVDDSVLDLATVHAPGGSSTTTPAGSPRRVLVRQGRRTRFVPLSEVDWFEADGNYIVVHAGAERYRTRGTISAIEAVLDPRQFVRIHRRLVVNMDRVRELTPLPGGDGMLMLGDGSTLRLSRTYRSRVR